VYQADELTSQIRGRFPGTEGRLMKDCPMAHYSTFKAGGSADLVFFPSETEELVFAVETARILQVPITVLGNGSNILVSDRGIRGLTVILSKYFSTMEQTEQTQIVVQAGALLSAVAGFAAENSLTGMEFAGGIPGTIGGAIYMNAGAYGGCMENIVVRTQGYCPDQNQVFMLNDSASHQFAYRKSIYSSGKSIVLKIWLKLQKGDKEAILAKMEDFAVRRKNTQPLDLPSAGSTFKRPADHFAGKLIEEAGLKGYRIGGASVCEKHAGFIVNDQNATANDIHDLIRYVQKTVWEKHGIQLEPEVCLIGQW
jgi:UDP-N-acetylmuramate dehydrogenase